MSRARNLVASVDHQLRNLAQQNSRPIADVRIRYVLERFLYRLVAVQGRVCAKGSLCTAGPGGAVFPPNQGH